MSELDLQLEEDIVFSRIYHTFLLYSKFYLRKIESRIENFQSLPKRQQDYLPDHVNDLNELKISVKINQEILKEILKPQKSRLNTEIKPDKNFLEYDKVVSQVFHQISREWSEDGKAERELCFQPIVDAINTNLDTLPAGNVLVPGCGLGRLCHDISAKTGLETIAMKFMKI